MVGISNKNYQWIWPSTITLFFRPQLSFFEHSNECGHIFSERWLLLTILLDFLFKKKSKLTLSVLFGLSTLLGIKPINVVSGWVWFSHDFLQNSNGRYFWRITPVAHVIESRSRDSPKFRIYSSKFQLINAKIDFFVLILGSCILGGVNFSDLIFLELLIWWVYRKTSYLDLYKGYK